MPYYKVVKENETKTLKDYSKPSTLMPSYIGMLDISTTNSTLEKVQAIYGSETTWIQHSGYILRGATSGVVANSATKTGGSDDAIVPYHRHKVAPVNTGTESAGHTHSGTTSSVTINGGNGSVGGAVNPGTFGGGVGHLFFENPTGYGQHSHTFTTNGESALHFHTVNEHYTNYEGTSGNTANANIPNYKSVYIWERTA